ncbi:hypothetical protein MRX96_048592 [Rhipicephalus microplus]
MLHKESKRGTSILTSPLAPPNVSGSDHAKAAPSYASPSLVYKPNYTHHSFKRGVPVRSSVTKDQKSSQPFSSACRSTSAARLYHSNRPSGPAMSSLVSKFSNLSVHAGDNAKRVSQTSKVSQAKNVRQAENVKERCLPHAEPRKPGQPLRARNTKAPPCSDTAMTKKQVFLFPRKLPLSPSLPSKPFERERRARLRT